MLTVKDQVSASIEFGRPVCLPAFFGAATMRDLKEIGLSKPPARGKTFHNYYESRRCLLADLSLGDMSGSTKVAMQDLLERLRATFRFDYSVEEPELNFIRYANTEYFDWHIDMSPDGAIRRKLSFSIQLTESADYEGGELEFFPTTNFPAARQAGSVIVFPPFVPHRVTPITRGTRFALVGWLYGPPFR